MKCDDCKVGYCAYRNYNTERECPLQNAASSIITKTTEGTKVFLAPVGTTIDIDWPSFRIEAAKDILCSMVSGGYGRGRESEQATLAIRYADELIKQLKEK